MFQTLGIDVYEDLDLSSSIIDATGRRARQRYPWLYMDGFFGIRDIVLNLLWEDLIALNAMFKQYHAPVPMAQALELARNHWGDQLRYQRDYHFTQAQQQIFDEIAMAMLSPKGGHDGFSSACSALSRLIINAPR